MRRLALAALLAAAGCPSPRAPAAAPPRVIVETAGGARHPVSVEIARTDEERARGLMHRTSLPAEGGMLFLFEETRLQVFWMRNTLIPLDILFADEAGIVVGIVERAEPLTEVPRSVGVPSRYVLEVNGGWCAAKGVRPGDRLRFENVPRF